jgi:ribokinase
MNIVVVGSLNVDSVVTVERFARLGETVIGNQHAIYPGGKGGNQAFAAARMCVGISGAPKIRMLGQVGDDENGNWLLRRLAEGGVDVSGVSREAGITSGIASITLDRSGQNQIVVVPGANGSFTPAHLHNFADTVKSTDIVLLQLEIPLATVLHAARIAHAASARIILDPAPAVSVSDELLSLCDFVTPNETELQTLLGRPDMREISTRNTIDQDARSLIARGARNVIVKMGKQGARCFGPTLNKSWPAYTVDAVDTTAAGDTWNGAFAAALAIGQSVDEAGTTACAAAAISVTRRGAQPSMPTRDEVETLMSKS